MADHEMTDRITYEDKLIQILDVVDGEGKVHARLTIVRNTCGRIMHKFNEVYPGGIEDPTKGGLEDEDD